MLKSLRRKLALAYTLMAFVVLAAVALISLSAAEREFESAAYAAFQSGVDEIVYKLQADRTLSSAYLAQSEAGNRQVIYVEDAGVPLNFRGSWTPQTPRDELIERALEEAQGRGLALQSGDAEAISDAFEMPTEDGGTCLARVTLFPLWTSGTPRGELIQRALEAAEAGGLALELGSLSPAANSFALSGNLGERYYACVTLIPTANAGSPIRVAVIKDMSEADGRIAQLRRTALWTVLTGLIALAVIGWLYSGHAVGPAEENQRRQVEFTAVASHELKAPLAVISASADALKPSVQDEAQRALLGNLASAARRCARLVDDLLLLSRSDAQNWRMRIEAVDADTLLIECYELYQPLYAAKGVHLTIDLPEAALGAVMGSEERLKQVLMVLLDNALSYTPAGGRVTLGGRAGGRGLSLFVADTGPGIPNAQKARVFERFYRADEAHADRAHFGLGLSIARELVRLHGGKLTISDEHPHGARFTVEIPRGHKPKQHSETI